MTPSVNLWPPHACAHVNTQRLDTADRDDHVHFLVSTCLRMGAAMHGQRGNLKQEPGCPHPLHSPPTWTLHTALSVHRNLCGGSL